jgi:hypothetical protein
MNLDQVAGPMTTGDAPDVVAKKLRTTEIGREVDQQIVTTTYGAMDTLDITAADPIRGGPCCSSAPSPTR